MANSKRQLFLKRRLRVRNKLRKVNAGRIRLSVHRSNKNISAQLIDDVSGRTLAAASSLEKSLGIFGKNNLEASAKWVQRWQSAAKLRVLRIVTLIVADFSFTGVLRLWPMPRVKAD